MRVYFIYHWIEVELKMFYRLVKMSRDINQQRKDCESRYGINKQTLYFARLIRSKLDDRDADTLCLIKKFSIITIR